MRRQNKFGLGLLCTAVGSLVLLATLNAGDGQPSKEAPKKDDAKKEAAASPIKAKALSDSIKKGLAYLVSQQHTDGGWGQGGGWRNGNQGGGRVEGTNVADPSDVASTCMATLALIRAGNTPTKGEYAKNVLKGVDFICNHIEKSDDKTLYVTDVRDTQVQVKIGPYVDTFLTTMVLAELKGKMENEKAEARLKKMTGKVIAKIEKNQEKDGTFAGNNGWASVLSQGLASKGLNRAAQNGIMVKSETLARDSEQSAKGLDPKSGKFDSADSVAKAAPPGVGGAGVTGTGGRAAGGSVSGKATGGPATSAPVPSDAGVPIYNTSARAAGLQETVNSLKQGEKKARDVVADKDAPKEEKEKAVKHLARLEKAEEAQTAAVRGVVAQVDEKGFIQGFGSNGGEEFLSYMNISETLVVKGGKEWEKWDKSVTDNMNRTQDKDGGWSGQHCITGRTFCTAAALLTLMADRTPMLVSAPAPEKK